jgi:hypothetical protein
MKVLVWFIAVETLPSVLNPKSAPELDPRAGERLVQEGHENQHALVWLMIQKFAPDPAITRPANF